MARATAARTTSARTTMPNLRQPRCGLRGRLERFHLVINLTYEHFRRGQRVCFPLGPRNKHEPEWVGNSGPLSTRKRAIQTTKYTKHTKMNRSRMKEPSPI